MGTAGAWIAIIAAVAGGLTGFAALIKTFLEKPRYRADAMTLVTNAATGQMERLRQDNDDVRSRLTSVEGRLDEALRKIDHLEDQLDREERKNRDLAEQNDLLRRQVDQASRLD